MIVLRRLLNEKVLSSFKDELSSSLENLQTLLRNIAIRPTWESTLDSLNNRNPSNHADLHALAIDHLIGLKDYIRHSSTNIFSRFWNQDSNEDLTEPKTENIGRDVLLELLKHRLTFLEISINAEHLIYSRNRVDILLSYLEMNCPIEVKRHFHKDVWRTIKDQVIRYSKDYGSNGYAIYCVLWFGAALHDHSMPKVPAEYEQPQSAEEMEYILNLLIPEEHRHHFKAIVIDVTKPVKSDA